MTTTRPAGRPAGSGRAALAVATAVVAAVALVLLAAGPAAPGTDELRVSAGEDVDRERPADALGRAGGPEGAVDGRALSAREDAGDADRAGQAQDGTGDVASHGAGGDAGSGRLPGARAARPAERSEDRSPSPSATPSPSVVQEGDGELVVVPGTSRRAGEGPLLTYLVETEGGLGVDGQDFAADVERTLSDPRSWIAEGRSVQRVDDPERADVRVALASPTTTDELCLPLRTVGIYSCEIELRAVINQMRWLEGSDTYSGDLTSYRHYVLNHEVGHALGHGHVQECDAQGRSPVMAQQTKSLFGCGRNPWPYPDAGR